MKLKGKFAATSSFAKVALWAGLLIVCFGLTMLLCTLWIKATGNQSVNELKLLQTLQEISIFLLPALLAVYLWSEQPIEWLHLNKGMSWKIGILTPLLILLASPGINLLCALNEQIALPDFLSGIEQIMKDMESAAAEMTELLAAANNLPTLLVNLFVMALIPAICEETAFRGACQGLIKGNKHVAIWVTAILFSAIHFQFYGFIPRMLLGATFGYLLVWTGSLYVPMLAHLTNNSIAVIGFYFANKGLIISDKIEQFGTGDTLWAGILSLLLSCTLFYLIMRIAKNETAHLLHTKNQ